MLPLAAYLTLFGFIRLFGKPRVTTGGRDFIAVAIAVSGLVVIGPAELFFPAAAAMLFGVAIWPVLTVLYFLLVLLVILSSRPRLVIYGSGPRAISEPLLRAAQSLDGDATLDQEAGTVVLPRSGVHLRLEGHRGSDASEVFAYETNTTPIFWNRLNIALRSELAAVESVSPRRGGMMFATGIIILLFLTLQMVAAPEAVTQGFREWLWR